MAVENAKRTRTLLHLTDGLINSASKARQACMVLIALLVSRVLSYPFPSSLYIYHLSDVQKLNSVCVPLAYVSALGSLDETFLHYVSLSLSLSLSAGAAAASLSCVYIVIVASTVGRAAFLHSSPTSHLCSNWGVIYV